MGLQVVLEENPKWELAKEVLREVTEACASPDFVAWSSRASTGGAVALVIARDDRTCKLLQEYLCVDQRAMLKRELCR
jgi:hypothetical protein